MKILKKEVKCKIACQLCGCEFEISGKDWRKVEKNNSCFRESAYGIHCPNCKHFIKIIPGEIRCKK